MNEISKEIKEDKYIRPLPVILCILDGWGERVGGDDNAIYKANTPNWDRMVSIYPNTRLKASAIEVGLPSGQMGNSEVGHMNLGAGRVVTQDLPLIDQAIAEDSLRNNPVLVHMIKKLTESRGACHLLGLASPGGVHSHQDHLIALANILDSANIPSKLHAFLDGRDTAQSSAKGFIEQIIERTRTLSQFSVETICGRYWAMDRDNNWDRIEKAYNLIAHGIGIHSENASLAIEDSYKNDKTDEFILPHVIGNYDGIHDGDAILMFNFRSDRAREIMASLADPGFDEFKRQNKLNLVSLAGMTEYSNHLNKFLGSLFPQRKLKNILGEVISKAGLTQLRTAETEKYAHVTFFFNGGDEKVFPGEERILIPSPKVPTYDLKPEMAAIEVTNSVVSAIKSNKFDVIIVNYANGDMVGHTGVFEAAVKAAETIDDCLKKIEENLIKAGGTMLITADHGNLEQMNDPHTHGPHTAHTLSAVPLVIVNPPNFVGDINEGVLADVSPTILKLLGLNQPSEMTGNSLIKELQTQNVTT